MRTDVQGADGPVRAGGSLWLRHGCGRECRHGRGLPTQQVGGGNSHGIGGHGADGVDGANSHNDQDHDDCGNNGNNVLPQIVAAAGVGLITLLLYGLVALAAGDRYAWLGACLY